MILEVAILNVIPNQEQDFEIAFAKASGIIASMAGYISHQLQRSKHPPIFSKALIYISPSRR